MKAIIIAAMLALSPVQAMSADTTSNPRAEELMTRAGHIEEQCLSIITDKKTMTQVAREDNLDTQAKRDDFAVNCLILMDSFSAGQESNQKPEPTS